MKARTLIALALLASQPALARAQEAKRPPNIVFLLADDLGWKDVGWHGSEIKTPHLDKLANGGVRLERFYVMHVCTPTRASLMTGRHPIRYGLQTGVIRPWSDYSLPLEERLLAQALQSAGYYTAITGKWHLGQSGPNVLPTRRGFDHQYGHYTGAIDYWDHRRFGGLDWHRNDRALVEEGYTTQLLAREAVRVIEKHDTKRPLFLYVPFNAPHSPLQAPKEYLDRYKGIENKQRRTYAAMVSCLDDAVGEIMAALAKRGMTANTLVLFSSDNGGPLNLGANNGTLRAGKATLYEGGVRVPAFAHWPGRLRPGVIDAPLHMVDWYPTLLRLAGASLEQKLPLDGQDVWPVLTGGRPPADRELLINAEAHRGALVQGPWKVVVTGALPRPAGAGMDGVELFHLGDDPSEKTNRAAKEPARTRTMLARLDTFARAAVPARGGKAGKQPAGWKAPKVYGEKE